MYTFATSNETNLYLILMKAKTNLMSLVLASCSIFLLSSCEKEVYDPSKVDKTTDLVVPEGFDWALTRSVDISMQSKNGTYASFYLDEDCNDLVAEMPVPAGKSSISLVLPTSSSKIWVKYPVKEGKEEVKEIAVKQKADTRAAGAPDWTAESLFPDYAEHSDNTMTAKYQPRKDQYGTIMFEDMWPEIGDYDFNDYVVNYNIIAEHKEFEGDFDHVYVTMKLKLRAIGGSKPYRFCIRIGAKPNSASMELRKKDVTLGEITFKNNSVNGTVEMLENTEYAVIALTGFDKLKDKTGGQFYNTEKAHLINNNETPEITIKFTVSGDAYSLFNGFGSEFAFDYFLQNTDNNREIHFIDYPPTDMYGEAGYNKDKKDGNTTFYCSERQFVWALKAPVEMGWCVETKDISKVYPEFPVWVRKGGDWLEENSIWDSNRQWYNRPAPGSKDYINPKEH